MVSKRPISNSKGFDAVYVNVVDDKHVPCGNAALSVVLIAIFVLSCRV